MDPNEILRNAMQRHAGGDISGAVSQVEALLVEYPKFATGFSYLGQTKVTRLRQFSDGVTYLDQAVELFQTFYRFYSQVYRYHTLLIQLCLQTLVLVDYPKMSLM